MPIADFWLWLSAGVVLMIIEIIVPGIFFLWIGFGAFITGLIAMVFTNTPPALLGLLFAVLSIVSVLLGKKLMTDDKNKPESGLNNRTASYIGQIYKAQEDFVNGRGKIKIGDSLWQASCSENVNAGNNVKVIKANATVLEVEVVSENQ